MLMAKDRRSFKRVFYICRQIKTQRVKGGAKPAILIIKIGFLKGSRRLPFKKPILDVAAP